MVKDANDRKELDMITRELMQAIIQERMLEAAEARRASEALRQRRAVRPGGGPPLGQLRAAARQLFRAASPVDQAPARSSS